jgi:hypothetical protein
MKSVKEVTFSKELKPFSKWTCPSFNQDRMKPFIILRVSFKIITE